MTPGYGTWVLDPYTREEAVSDPETDPDDHDDPDHE
jgi:hypothetical protein